MRSLIEARVYELNELLRDLAIWKPRHDAYQSVKISLLPWYWNHASI